jgi:hypothetical protein
LEVGMFLESKADFHRDLQEQLTATGGNVVRNPWFETRGSKPVVQNPSFQTAVPNRY